MSDTYIKFCNLWYWIGSRWWVLPNCDSNFDIDAIARAARGIDP